MSIRLHPEKGVNPRVMVCHNCGKDVGLVLLGQRESLYRCEACGAQVVGRGSKCPACGERGTLTRVRKIDDHEKLAVGYCDECQQRNDLVTETVRAGGIHWRCTKCGSAGAVHARAPISQLVREQMGIEPPESCGIEFTGPGTDDTAGCPVCEAAESGKDLKLGFQEEA